MGHQRAKGLPVPHIPTVQGGVTAVTQLDGCPIAGGDSSEGWGWDSHNGLKPKTHRDGRGTDRDKDNTLAKELVPSLPSLRAPGPCAPSAGTRGWQWGSTRRVPSPQSCWHSGWASSPAPPQACHQHPAPQMGSGNCSLPGGEGIWHRAAMAASQCTHCCQGCPERALSLPPPCTQHMYPFPATPATTPTLLPPNPAVFLEVTPSSIRPKGV